MCLFVVWCYYSFFVFIIALCCYFDLFRYLFVTCVVVLSIRVLVFNLYRGLLALCLVLVLL